MDEAALGELIEGGGKPGDDALEGLAGALGVSAETLRRLAGAAPTKKESDPMGEFITKDDGETLDFERMGTPEAQRPLVAALWKEARSARREAEAARETAERLRKEADRAALRKSVEELSHVGSHDELTEMLLKIADPIQRAEILGALRKADRVADAAGITREVGATGSGGSGGGGASDADMAGTEAGRKILALAKSRLEKETSLGTEYAAMAAILETAEGRELYAQHRRELGLP